MRARLLTPALLVVTVAYFWAFKSGRAPVSPTVFGTLIGLVCLGLFGELVWTVWDLMHGRDRKATAAARVVVALGLLLVGGGGFTNWLFSLQGFMVLTEGEIRPLFQGENLTEFEAGLLADPTELDITLALREVELRPGGRGAFFPESVLEVARGHEEPTLLKLSGPTQAKFGSLLFHGGAFGFSPRIVILQGDAELFDRAVPFLTRLQGGTGISFEQTFTVAEHGLEVRGTVLLESLDEAMRGHPTLALELKRDGEVLGAGTLLPGHFADLEDSYRLGFAGMKMWQEIDISRRNYPEPMLIGAVIAALGVLLWIGAAIREFFR